ncbi:MAG TPA: SdpI family protein [Puia sp.]|jgi:uncharacterized membrane protein|nr:SdpI family protein [Puia sp.]
MKKWIPDLLVVILLLIPFLYLIETYSSLPAVVPTHFGIDGKPNGYSSKSSLVWILGFVALISGGSYLLIKNLPKIDPKKTAAMASGKLRNIALAVVALMTAIMISIMYSAIHGIFSFNRILNPLLGIFFTIIGNLMYNIKPNYFVGVRVPWTLENEDNWRATHRVAGILWVICGLLITIFTLFLPAQTAEYFLICGTAIMALVPILYSFNYFRTHRTNI